jgi:predicted membrane chloride channel (bestrophin family)
MEPATLSVRPVGGGLTDTPVSVVTIVRQASFLLVLASVGHLISRAANILAQVISELVEQCGVSDIKEDKLFSTLRAMGDTIAVCDKLLRYPLPLAWSRHTSRCDKRSGT